jgi:hypothetical protein
MMVACYRNMLCILKVWIVKQKPSISECHEKCCVEKNENTVKCWMLTLKVFWVRVSSLPLITKINTIYYIWGSRDSSVGIATGYGLDDQGGGSSSPGRVNNFHFSISSRPALGSTQPPIKWVKRQGREADFHLQLVPRSRKCGSIHPLPYTSSWRNA